MTHLFRGYDGEMELELENNDGRGCEWRLVRVYKGSPDPLDAEITLVSYSFKHIKMASIMEKIKETVVPSNNEGYNTNPSSYGNEPPSYSESSHHSNNNNSGIYNSVTENNTQREFSSNNSAPLESTSTQNEGVRTGDRINSLVENVPGVSSSSTQNKSSTL